ncbi:hypothetical protein AGOR_G00248060 [Albula goreensis]|uniref:Uncharacterized protein n=1 Tax=Albula goreensis TaxID=1534307 RepID=A0A8T3CFV0_9TELE|nr:hypothetical protein AGOR_G00248060 [Albula goreensis]
MTLAPGLTCFRERVRDGGYYDFPVQTKRHRVLSRGKYGKFNSDTYGCSGIQSRSCRTSADCTGCLGLYTCNISIATCKLKGVSRITDGFFLSLKRT